MAKLETNRQYAIERAEIPKDMEALKSVYSRVFDPEPVATLSDALARHFPRMNQRNWFVARKRDSREIVSALALIPWRWEMDGVELTVAEMGLVATIEEHRGRGLMKMLNREFDRVLIEESYDLSAIQGIPGFYHRFGFHYALDMENHINMPLHSIPADFKSDEYSFRLADKGDIPFLMQEDEDYRKSFFVSGVREEAAWGYLLTEGSRTEYGSEFWIMEHVGKKERHYFRIPFAGFGTGLIVAEIGESITHKALIDAFVFFGKKARERKKSYVRLNLHHLSAAAVAAVAAGAEKGNPYAWQVKIPDRIRLLRKMTPVLEKRIENSCFRNLTGTLKLDFFRTGILMRWTGGRLESVEDGAGKDCDNLFFMCEDLAAPLFLGRRDWREMQYVRPDIFPSSQYTGTAEERASEVSGLLMDVLFPPKKSWIYSQY